jgi:hypothetical protein
MRNDLGAEFLGDSLILLAQQCLDPDVRRTHDQRRYTAIGTTGTYITRGYGVAGRTIRL